MNEEDDLYNLTGMQEWDNTLPKTNKIIQDEQPTTIIPETPNNPTPINTTAFSQVTPQSETPYQIYDENEKLRNEIQQLNTENDNNKKKIKSRTITLTSVFSFIIIILLAVLVMMFADQNALKARIDTSQSTSQKNTQELSKLRQDASNKQNEINKLTQKQGQSKTEIDNAQIASKQKDKQLLDMQKEKDANQKALKEQQKTLDEKNATIKEQEKRIKELEKKNESNNSQPTVTITETPNSSE